jgi:DNA replication licensing factor MCM3
MLHSGVTLTIGRGSARRTEVVSIPFIKKYIQYAKSRVKPVLTKGAADHIVTVYSGLRNDELEGNQRKTSPLTARTLETLIRLSTAHAKSRLSNRVEAKDAEQAEKILRFALFKEVVEEERRKRRKTQREPDAMSTEDDSSDSDDSSDGDVPPPSSTRTRNGGPQTRGLRGSAATNGVNGHSHGTPTRAGAQQDNDDDDDDDDDDLYTATPRTQRTRPPQSQQAHRTQQTDSQSRFSPASSAPASQLLTSQTQGEEDNEESEDELVAPTDDRIRQFQTALGQLINGTLFANDAAEVTPLVDAINARVGGRNAFEKREAEAILEVLSERNKIM